MAANSENTNAGQGDGRDPPRNCGLTGWTRARTGAETLLGTRAVHPSRFGSRKPGGEGGARTPAEGQGQSFRPRSPFQ